MVHSFDPNRWLQGGDTVNSGKVISQVRHSPDHTPGHAIFLHEKSELAQVGDVLFKGSIGRTDFLRGDQVTLIASIKNGLWPLSDDVTFGPTSTFGEERRSSPFVVD